MTRWRLDLSYDGTDFHGWACQPGLRTVQGVLEADIARVLRLPQEPSLVVAGRTDAGVHARGQVCHLDLAADTSRLAHRLRRVLPRDVSLRSLTSAPAGFDARFSAIWRRYCYRLQAEPVDPLLRGHIVGLREPLELAALDQAAASMLGLRDFAAFCKARAGATTIRRLTQVQAKQNADGVIEIWLQADAFCHSMVRSLVGALTQVASGRRPPEWLAEVAATSQRHGGVPVMPAHGLTLEAVGYPPDEQLAQRAQQSRALRSLES